ncbi:DUF3718 domain-containing protein [Thalassotalea euphylliae]|uniref:DUF3718 domain-containing protein n=1 Tax=Thalassotalea euphylliae TaxID=1655234 RepID=A0A3E0TTA9_9GAMM|nr:DUF3718 domain-containing protein [Thalassotalea euphylliae]REL27212.1 DUF3718 domain-containing protein [Thalassotalea euphylliae]
MKKLLLVPAIALISSVSVAPAANANNLAQSLCEYVSADDKKRLRSFLKSNNLKIRSVFDGVQCNGQNLLAFASSKSAVKTGSLMISKLPKAKVRSSLASITDATLAQAANKRVNG